MSVTKLQLNNGSAPEPAATNDITLREFAGGPLSQQEAEYNFINLTDRINLLIDQSNTNESETDTEITNLTNAVNTNTANIASNQTGVTNLGTRMTAAENSVTQLDTLTGKPADYDDNASYAVGDRVLYNGVFYKCIQASQGNNPDTATLFWEADKTLLEQLDANKAYTDTQITTLTGTVNALNVPSLSFDSATNTLTITQQ
jgi:hypothetical protein